MLPQYEWFRMRGSPDLLDQLLWSAAGLVTFDRCETAQSIVLAARMSRTAPVRIFLLSPARLDGQRARLLFQPVTMFPVAQQLRLAEGAPIGHVFSFVSGLYFRGKLAYAEAFARPPRSLDTGVFVITTNRGLVPASLRVTLDDLARFAEVDIHQSSDAFGAPLRREAETLARALGPRGAPVCSAA